MSNGGLDKVKKCFDDAAPVSINNTVECAGTVIGNNTVNIYYLIMRILFGIGITSILFWSLIRWTMQGKLGIWPFYITHWGLSVNTIYIWSSVILHWKVYQSVDKYGYSHKNYQDYKSIDDLNLRFLWNFTLYFLDIGVALAVFIIILFWVLVYEGGEVQDISWNTHGTVGGLIVIEWITSTWQLTYKGALYICISSIVWIICSIIFYAAGLKDGDGNRYVYATIDWGDAPGTAVVYSIVTCIALPIFQIIIVAIKNGIIKCWLRTRTQLERDLIVATKYNDTQISFVRMDDSNL